MTKRQKEIITALVNNPIKDITGGCYWQTSREIGGIRTSTTMLDKMRSLGYLANNYCINFDNVEVKKLLAKQNKRFARDGG